MEDKYNYGWSAPSAQGLYDPKLEKDSCGVGFLAHIDGHKDHEILLKGKSMCERMEHRGAISSDNESGDGAGVLLGIPHEFYQKVLKRRMPSVYATGIIFTEDSNVESLKGSFTALAEEYFLTVFEWRVLPRDSSALGPIASYSEPLMLQVFISSSSSIKSNEDSNSLDFDTRVYILRKIASQSLNAQRKDLRFYICSLSSQIIVYKGQLRPSQLWSYFLDLSDLSFKTHIIVVHTRFSTNTFPSWEKAHPNRLLAHNGEINTLIGNVNTMRARERVLSSKFLSPKTLDSLYPVIETQMSDSGAFDNVLEFLIVVGRKSLQEALIMMVPEALSTTDEKNERKKAFFKWSSCLMEPWDGPALLSFSDGRFVGALLDRNGLRPARYVITRNNLMILASEVGVVSLESSEIAIKGRLGPGNILLVDTTTQRILFDREIKEEIYNSRPFGDLWAHHVSLEKLKSSLDSKTLSYTSHPIILQNNNSETSILHRVWNEDRRLPLFGYNLETIELLLIPMMRDKKEALGSMGNDVSLPCLSQRHPLLYDYFKQLFAQVTNPPIDPFREKIVMSLEMGVGPLGNILNEYEPSRKLWLRTPILSPLDLKIIIKNPPYKWKIQVIESTFEYGKTLKEGIESLCILSETSIRKENVECLILSDRILESNKIPIPASLAIGALHHHLLRIGLRGKVSLFLETGEPREIHHFCLLLAYGADGICPYIVYDLFFSLVRQGLLTECCPDSVFENYKTAVNNGIFKVMAKMGISTLQSYKGAQIFEAIGIHTDVIHKCFEGTFSRIEGISWSRLNKDSYSRHSLAFGKKFDTHILPHGGFYHWRSGEEEHVNEPNSIAILQAATANGSQTQHYKEYSELTHKSISKCTLRGQWTLLTSQTPIPLTEVEEAQEIVKRFVTGAMSFGSISYETHVTLATAMNQIGGKSNSGEGGEKEARYLDPKSRSAIKQVASGRFGVTASYLAHAQEIQIKMAQGAKPGEGGELPGYKVTESIASTRHSLPGVGLISPPPHHDIYSIEDLSQLIYDLKSVNPKAVISVKLVSEVGVGVVAAGVVKGGAEHILISGHDGGTGASSWTGIKSAGAPWELGLSEIHQTLVVNNLRDRVVLGVDGGLRHGFDVLTAGILGAEEFGFSTVPLISLGCIMMRKCHLNTCPVGIATQDPELRRKFSGKPENVINYFFLLAEEIRTSLSLLGLRKFEDIIGQTQFLKAHKSFSESPFDFRKILHRPLTPNGELFKVKRNSSDLRHHLVNKERIETHLLSVCKDVIEGSQNQISLTIPIDNSQRAFGATLSYAISRIYHEAGLPPSKSIHLHCKGSAGLSFGAFLVRGLYCVLEGDANDFVGKGLSGGHLTLFPPKDSSFNSEDNVIAGNVCCYGGTSGRAFFRGLVSERFCVRNSGVIAVAEGVGDHGCEYMTGGKVVILGATGRNFGAGMTGGLAYVYDERKDFADKCNHDTIQLIRELSRQDEEFLLSILREFKEETGSVKAASLLSNWSDALVNFVKVFPFEYQRACSSKTNNLEHKESQKREEMQETKEKNGIENEEIQIIEKEEKIEKEIDENIEKECKNQGESQEEKKEIKIKEVEQFDIKDIEELISPPDKLRGFMKYKRERKGLRDVAQRMNDFNEIYNFEKIQKTIQIQSARCMDCGIPFCHSTTFGCPLGNMIPVFNTHVYRNHWKEAFRTLMQTNNFPEFTGRVCPAPCEGSCVLGLSESAVTIKNIEVSIIERAFEKGWILPRAPLTRTTKTVGIIGSGPAGLAAADQLNKAGHSVTVYERNSVLGGLLRVGIPSMKLSKDVVQRRIDLLEKEGIVFRCNYTVNASNALSIKKRHDALIIATGSTVPRDVFIKGRDAKGIFFAMDYLDSHSSMSAKDLDVIVIGGGDTGTDCIATALRQGAKSITALEVLPSAPKTRAENNPWPQYPKVFKLDYGHEEVLTRFKKEPRVFSRLSKEFKVSSTGSVSGVETVQVDWTIDETGNWTYLEVPETQKNFPAQMVLIAIGFQHPQRDLLDSLGLHLNEKGLVIGKYESNVIGIFSAGDCRRGQSLVVWAISEGRQVARQVDTFLTGEQSCLPDLGGILHPCSN